MIVVNFILPVCTHQKIEASYRFTTSSLLILAMAGRIKFFQTILQIYETIGIYPPHQTDQKFTFNVRNFVFLFSHAQLFISTLACLLYDATSVYDYGSSFYGCITGIYIFYYVSYQLGISYSYEYFTSI